jgi:hypothetical protein
MVWSGPHLAIRTGDTVRVYDALSFEERFVLSLGESEFTGPFAFCSRRCLVASVSSDGRVIVRSFVVNR